MLLHFTLVITLTITINLEPVALSRPRVNTTNRGRYLPKHCQNYLDELRLLLRAAFRQQPFDAPLAVTVHFYRPRTPTAKNFGDIDNLAKAVLDAANGVIWTDDRLITELRCYKHKGTGKIILEVVDIDND